MSRRTKDERRRDYLDIGMELVAEGPGAVPPDPGLALAHVRIAEVAERAGVTKGALYHLWDSQEAYWHDLLRYLLDDHRLAGFADVPDVTRQLADELGVRPTAAQWANFVFDHFKDEPTFFARIGVFSYLQDDEFRRGLDEEFRTSLDRFEEITSDYVRANGRRARPGMEIRDFAVAVSALMQGLCLEHRVRPGPDTRRRRRWRRRPRQPVRGRRGGAARGLHGTRARRVRPRRNGRLMARPTAEDRRRDYLQVGADIVAEFDLANAKQVPLDALANVKVAEVARRAGVTKGALYHIWDSQEDYRRDLLQHLLELEEQAGIRETTAMMDSLSPGLDLGDVFCRPSDYAFDRLKDDPKMLARFSFYNYADDPEVNRLLSHGATAFESYYDTYLRAAHRRVREPFTLQQMVTSSTAYFFGMIIRHRTSPLQADAAVEREGRRWSLYTFGLRALIDHFTEPVDDPAGA